jgi:hypothetical protein
VPTRNRLPEKLAFQHPPASSGGADLYEIEDPGPNGKACRV